MFTERDIKRKGGEERTRWRVREKDREKEDPHKLEEEASTDHPIGERLG